MLHYFIHARSDEYLPRQTLEYNLEKKMDRKNNRQQLPLPFIHPGGIQFAVNESKRRSSVAGYSCGRPPMTFFQSRTFFRFHLIQYLPCLVSKKKYLPCQKLPRQVVLWNVVFRENGLMACFTMSVLELRIKGNNYTISYGTNQNEYRKLPFIRVPICGK